MTYEIERDKIKGMEPFCYGYDDNAGKEEKLFKFILKCKKSTEPDLHSFVIKIDRGIAFVECSDYEEVYIEAITYTSDGKETRAQFCGTPIAATNFLERRNAIFETIEQ